MKKFILQIALTTFLLTNLHAPVWSQPSPPPNHNESRDQPTGGGAPIGDGMFLLLAFSAAYSARKVYGARQEEKDS